MVRHGQEPIVDAVDAKWIEPAVKLGKLVASALSVPWSAGLVAERLVWPEDGAEEDEGPWVTELSDNVRDSLADIASWRIPDLVIEWAQIEEWGGGADLEYLGEVLRELVGLSQRARDAGEHLYCWTSL